MKKFQWNGVLRRQMFVPRVSHSGHHYYWNHFTHLVTFPARSVRITPSLGIDLLYSPSMVSLAGKDLQDGEGSNHRGCVGTHLGLGCPIAALKGHIVLNSEQSLLFVTEKCEGAPGIMCL